MHSFELTVLIAELLVFVEFLKERSFLQRSVLYDNGSCIVMHAKASLQFCCLNDQMSEMVFIELAYLG